MYALTLRHPWPWAVCRVGKRLENRDWLPTPFQLRPGDWFAIHGGKPPSNKTELSRVVLEAMRIAERHSPDSGPGCLLMGDLFEDVISYSGIVAVCKYGGHVRESDDPWFEGPLAWVLSDLVLLPRPIPCKGNQKLWPLPLDVLVQVREGYKEAVK